MSYEIEIYIDVLYGLHLDFIYTFKSFILHNFFNLFVVVVSAEYIETNASLERPPQAYV